MLGVRSALATMTGVEGAEQRIKRNSVSGCVGPERK
jgi:hypothetical protein